MRACLVARSCGVPHANSTCNRGKKWKKANSGSEREREQEGDQLNEGKSSKPKKTATHTHFKFTISSSSEKGREREGCTDRSRSAMLKVVHFSSEFGAGGIMCLRLRQRLNSLPSTTTPFGAVRCARATHLRTLNAGVFVLLLLLAIVLHTLVGYCSES